MDFNVALEMAALGSKVLHPRCVELGAKFSIPIIVRNSFKADDSNRTIISMFTAQEALEAPVVSGVSVDKDVARVAISGLSKQADLISKIFDCVAKDSINVDIIVHNRLDDEQKMHIGFTISEGDLDKAVKVINAFRGTPGFDELAIETEKNLAKVSVVGLGMQLHHGVASRAFTALTSKGVDIKMISTSEIKISCVVPKTVADIASQCLHDEFCHL
jgi:aspartate kinase